MTRDLPAAGPPETDDDRPGFDEERRPLDCNGEAHRHAHLPPVRRGYLVLLLILLVPTLSTDRPDDLGRPWSGAQGLRMVGRVARHIQAHALRPPTDRQIYEAAAAAMLSRVGDQYTHFLPPRLGNRTMEILDDEPAGGIGALLRPAPGPEGGFEVENFFPDSAARDAGLEKDDRIVAVDGLEFDPRQPVAMYMRLRGAPDSPMVLTYVRNGEKREVFLRRRRLPDATLTVKRILPERPWVGYLRLGVFSRRAPDLLEGAVRELSLEGMRALVIDLRGNGGGDLEAGERSADLFLDRGVIAITERRGPTPDSPPVRRVRHALPDSLGNFPIVILIDNETASASELFAAALRDNRRAILVGSRSFGKSAIQELIPLDANGAAVRLTTGRYLTPMELDIAGKGLLPDRPVRLTEKQVQQTQRVLEMDRYGMPPPEGYVDPVLDAAVDWLARLRRAPGRNGD